MQLTETARVRLLIDGQDALSELTKLENKYENLVDEQRNFTKRSQEWKDLGKEIRETSKSIDKVRERADVTKMTFSELNRYQRDLVKSLKDMQVGSEDYVKTTAKLKDVNTRLSDIRSDMRTTTQTVSQSKGVWDNLKSWVLGAFAVQAIIAFGRRIVAAGVAVFELTAKFESYNTVLSKMLGGQEEAAAAMEMIKDVAATTNWSVDELTDSFIKLTGRGLKPTPQNITAVSDVANFLKKDFGQLVEAINDVNNTERWNEIGIKAKTSGDKVSLTFRGVTQTVARTEEGVLGAITAFGQMDGVMGVTAAVSGTLEGKLSNLGDAWDFVQVSLGERLRPVFVFILDLFAKAVDWVARLIDASEPLGTYYGILAGIIKQVWDIGKQLFIMLIPAGAENMLTMSNVIKAVAAVMGTMLLAVKAVVSSIQVLIDGFIVAKQAGSVFWQVMKGDFEGAKTAAAGLDDAWSDLKTNATKNFGSIKDDLVKLWSATGKETDVATDKVDMYGKLVDSVQEDATETTKAESDKRKKVVEDEADQRTKKLTAHVEEIKGLEADTLDVAKKTNRDITADLEEHLDRRQRAIEEQKQAEWDETQQTGNAIADLLDGDVRGFQKAMGDKLTASQNLKIGMIAQAMEWAQFISDKLNELVGKMADMARQFIAIGQMRLDAAVQQMNNERDAATLAKRQELQDIEDQIFGYEKRVADLRLEYINTTDERRKAAIEAEIERLENLKNEEIIKRDATAIGIEAIEKRHDEATRARRLEAWQKQKELEIKLANINAVQAYIKALSSGFPPFNLANAAMVVGVAKAQIELIKAEQPPSDLLIQSNGANNSGEIVSNWQERIDNAGSNSSPRMANGSIIMGSSHGQGGIDLYDRGKGRVIGNMEGGEFMGVFSREVTRKHGKLLHRLANSNLIQTGKPFYAADGVFGNINQGDIDNIAAGAGDAYQMAVRSTNSISSTAENMERSVQLNNDQLATLRSMADILGRIANSNDVIAAKNFSVSVNAVVQAGNQMAEVDRMSEFG